MRAAFFSSAFARTSSTRAGLATGPGASLSCCRDRDTRLYRTASEATPDRKAVPHQPGISRPPVDRNPITGLEQFFARIVGVVDLFLCWFRVVDGIRSNLGHIFRF